VRKRAKTYFTDDVVTFLSFFTDLFVYNRYYFVLIADHRATTKWRKRVRVCKRNRNVAKRKMVRDA